MWHGSESGTNRRCRALSEPEQADTGTVIRTYQEGAKEDERDEVEVGKVTPTLTGIGIWVTGPVAQTRQHDFMPGLPCGTPEKKNRAMSPQQKAWRENL